ncbi:MAG: hypothetical protein GVY18_09020 [Bacteroidetes bacterium]|jgi:hypothetical protein|nr:hypothetical protein [Bacteroidota bacterium]
MLTLSQLRTPISKEKALEDGLEILSDLGFDTTSWQTGSWQRTFVQFFTDGWSGFTQYADTVSRIVFNESSTGDALTNFSKSHYDNERDEGSRAEHTLRLTCELSSGPYTIVAEERYFRETHTGDELQFFNTTSGLLDPGGTLDVTVKAEAIGSDYNVPVGTITEQVTPLAGVTVTNPDLGDGSSVTSVGTDAQSDSSLQTSNTNKWGTLSWSTPAAGYLYFAQQGSSNIARLKTNDGNPRGPGTIDIYIATDEGVASSADQSAAQTAIEKRHAGTPNPEVKIASGSATAFSANVYVDSANFEGGSISASKKTEIESALRGYVNSLPIGGEIVQPPDGDGVTGYIVFSEWVGAVTAVDGVTKVGSPNPASDEAVGLYDVPTVGSITFTYVSV